jgi:hypothetical protein
MRIGRDQSIPIHVETLPLKTKVRVSGLVLGVLVLITGFAEAIWSEGPTGRVAGPLLVMVGGFLVIAIVRLQTYEITVGSKRIDVGTGFFRETVPSAAVESTELRPASGWRRLYADEELVFHFGMERGELVVPSRDPAALHSSVPELDRSSHRDSS